MAIKSSDQITIVDVTDGYSVMLTNQIYAFIGEIGETCTTEVVAFLEPKQFNQININKSDITCPANINALVENNGTSKVKVTFTTTGIISSQCEAIIPIVVDNITIEKRFSFTIIKNEHQTINGKTVDLVWANDGSNFDNTDSKEIIQSYEISDQYDSFIILSTSGTVTSIINVIGIWTYIVTELNIDQPQYALFWARRKVSIVNTDSKRYIQFDPCYYRAYGAGEQVILSNGCNVPFRIYGIKK